MSCNDCVLGPLLFTLMTCDCVSGPTTSHRLTEDTTEVDLRRDNAPWPTERRQSHLIMHVDKSKEVILGFRKNQPGRAPILSNIPAVEVVSRASLVYCRPPLVCEHHITRGQRSRGLFLYGMKTGQNNTAELLETILLVFHPSSVPQHEGDHEPKLF